MKDPKSRILAAAEKRFARHGIEGAPLRAITSDAGVNVAAVNYHFGNKENLIVQVFARFLLPLDAERGRLMEDATTRAGQAGPRVEDVVRAFLFPWFGLRKRHPELLRAFAQFTVKKRRRSDRFRDLIGEKAGEAYASFSGAVFAAMPGVPREKLAERMSLAVLAAASFLANDWLAEGLEKVSGVDITEDALFEHVVRVIEGRSPPAPGS